MKTSKPTPSQASYLSIEPEPDFNYVINEFFRRRDNLGEHLHTNHQPTSESQKDPKKGDKKSLSKASSSYSPLMTF